MWKLTMGEQRGKLATKVQNNPCTKRHGLLRYLDNASTGYMASLLLYGEKNKNMPLLIERLRLIERAKP